MSDAAGIIAEIEALEARRIAATVGKDWAVVERLLADDLRYVHGSGVDESKSLYLERLRSGHYDYKALTPVKRDFRVCPGVVLVNGDLEIDVVSGGTPRAFVSRYLQVWVQGADGWRMASWQSTPLQG
jgi:hypothetical protein